MKTIIATTMLACSFFIAEPTLAGDGEPHPEGRGGWRGPGPGMPMAGMQDPERMVGHISRWLELDDMQTQELRNVALAAKPQLQTLRDKALANHEAVIALDGNSGDYAAKIKNLALENGQIATEMTLLASQLRVDIRSKLTEEQRVKLSEGADRMRRGWRGKHLAEEE
jgi:Spy/CpxP family protein refolding chaperone